jgi:uncharacterized protein
MTGAMIQRCAAIAAAAAVAGPAGAQTSFNLAGETAAVPVTSLRDMPFRTVVRQQYDFSCGSAALATLLQHHYGRAVGEAEIFRAMYAAGDQAKIRKVGFSLLDMRRYLESTQGVKADGFRWSLADLERSQLPAIALIQVGSYRHFVVIKGVRAGKVLVGDPAQGLKLYPAEEFRRLWNGVVFVAQPAGGTTPAYDRQRDWAHFTLGPMDPLSDTALASFTRDLPPIYQIVAHNTGGGAIR